MTRFEFWRVCRCVSETIVSSEQNFLKPSNCTADQLNNLSTIFGAPDCIMSTQAKRKRTPAQQIRRKARKLSEREQEKKHNQSHVSWQFEPDFTLDSDASQYAGSEGYATDDWETQDRLFAEADREDESAWDWADLSSSATPSEEREQEVMTENIENI